MKRFRGVFAWFMAIALLVTPFASAQEATPGATDDLAPTPVVGSISVTGLGEGTPPAYSVTDAEGNVISGGILDSAFQESAGLIGIPGTQGTLHVTGNESYEPASVTAVAGSDGAFHFQVTLNGADSVEQPDAETENGQDESAGPENTVSNDAESSLAGPDAEPLDDESAVTVTINVTDDTGQPLANIGVSVLLPVDDSWYGFTTDLDGSAFVETQPGEISILIHAQKQWLGYSSPEPIEITGDQSIDIELSSVDFGTVSILCDSDTTTCSDHEGAWVLIYHQDSGWQDFGIIDANGTLYFDAVPVSDSPYTITIEQHGKYLEHEFQVTVTADDRDIEVTPNYPVGASATINFTFANANEESIWFGDLYLNGGDYEFTYGQQWDDTGQLSVQVLVGAYAGDEGYKYEYEARPSDGSFEPVAGSIYVKDGDDLQVDVIFEKYPVRTVLVQDPDGNPLSWVGVQVGTMNEGDGFLSYMYLTTDGSGSTTFHRSETTSHWRVQPFELWQGDSGELASDTTTITLQPVTEFGTITVDISESNVPWFDVSLIRADGWEMNISVNDMYADEDIKTAQIPAGQYNMVAYAGVEYEQISDTLEVEAGETYSLENLHFVSHPTVVVTILDQDNNPVPDVSVEFYGQGANAVWAGRSSDASGIVTVNLPVDEYQYEVWAPSKYAPHQGGVFQHQEGGSNFQVDLVVIPNGSLTIDVDTPEDFPVDSSITVLDNDGAAIDSMYIYSGGEITFLEFPYGTGYQLFVHETRWYPETFGAEFDFLEENEDDVVYFTMTPYEAVEVTVNATSTNNSPIGARVGLVFENAETGWGHNFYVEAADDGTSSGSIKVPRGEYNLVLWDAPEGLTSNHLPLAVDLTSVNSPYSIDIQLTPALGGYVTFTLSDSDVEPSNQSIEIMQNGDYVTSVWMDPDDASGTTWQVLPAGAYSWSFNPGGVLGPVGGTFTIVDGNVTVAVNLKVVDNGIIVVNAAFPEGINDLDKGGFVAIVNADSVTVSSRYVTDLSMFAIGPVSYGDYTIHIQTSDSRIADPEGTPVTVNSDSVNAAVSLTMVADSEPRMLTINVTNESGVEIRQGKVWAFGIAYDLDDDGSVEINVANHQSEYLEVVSINFEPQYRYWEESDGFEIEISLGTQRPVLELAIEDENGDGISGLYVDTSVCQASVRAEVDGVYYLGFWNEAASDCEVSVIDYQGRYQPIENETIALTGLLTQATLTMSQEDNLVSDFHLQLNFEGGIPALDEESGESIRVVLGSLDGMHSIQVTADENGLAVFPTIQTGEYSIYVFGFQDLWRYDTDSLFDEVVEVTTSNQNVDLTVSKLDLYPVNIRIETSDGQALESPVLVQVRGVAWLDVIVGVSGEATVYLPEEGPFYIYTDGSAFYLPAPSQMVEIVEDGLEILLRLERIASVPVPEDEVPSETPGTPTPTPTPTSTATSTPEAVTVLVRVVLSDGSSIVGAPWQLFAPVAAQQATGPLQTGVVGPDNRILLEDLMMGRYRLMIRPAGMEPIEVDLNVGAHSEELVVRIDLDQLPAPGGDPTATIGAETAASAVTGLPATGTGLSGGFSLPIAAMIAAFAIAVIAIPLGIVRDGRNRR